MYVYIIRSIPYPEQIYIGLAEDYKKRLLDHNSGKSPHTSDFKPWEIENFIWFKDGKKAAVFEKCFKSHSGRAFWAKHFK